jgi:DNA-binding HxlR family transcriptional regulator
MDPEEAMYDYGEACPISRATSILCERWTLQIVREMTLGATRFSEFQRYLPKISPSLLNTRLRFLEEHGVIEKRRIPEKRGHEYRLSPSGKALAPLLNEMGRWGMEWAHEGIAEEELNAVVLLREIAVLMDTDALPSGDHVLQFKFKDLGPEATRFILVQRDAREVCHENPGYEVDVYFESTLRTLAEVFWGDQSLAKARESGALGVVGASAYTKRLSRWFPVSSFARYNRVGAS